MNIKNIANHFKFRMGYYKHSVEGPYKWGVTRRFWGMGKIVPGMVWGGGISPQAERQMLKSLTSPTVRLSAKERFLKGIIEGKATFDHLHPNEIGATLNQLLGIPELKVLAQEAITLLIPPQPAPLPLPVPVPSETSHAPGPKTVVNEYAKEDAFAANQEAQRQEEAELKEQADAAKPNITSKEPVIEDEIMVDPEPATTHSSEFNLLKRKLLDLHYQMKVAELDLEKKRKALDALTLRHEQAANIIRNGAIALGNDVSPLVPQNASSIEEAMASLNILAEEIATPPELIEERKMIGQLNGNIHKLSAQAEELLQQIAHLIAQTEMKELSESLDKIRREVAKAQVTLKTMGIQGSL